MHFSNHKMSPKTCSIFLIINWKSWSFRKIFDFFIEPVLLFVYQNTAFIVFNFWELSLLMKPNIKLLKNIFTMRNIFSKRKLYFITIPIDFRSCNNREKINIFLIFSDMKKRFLYLFLLDLKLRLIGNINPWCSNKEREFSCLQWRFFEYFRNLGFKKVFAFFENTQVNSSPRNCSSCDKNHFPIYTSKSLSSKYQFFYQNIFKGLYFFHKKISANK